MNDKQNSAMMAQIAKNQKQASLGIRGSVNSNQQEIAKGIKKVRQLGEAGLLADATKAFNSLIAKYPIAGKFVHCPQCDTQTPHSKRECLLCGTSH